MVERLTLSLTHSAGGRRGGDGSTSSVGGATKGVGSRKAVAAAAVRASIGDVDTLDGQRAVLEALVQETEKVRVVFRRAGWGGVGLACLRPDASVSRS